MGLNTLGWWPIAVALVSGLGFLLAVGTGCRSTKIEQQLPPLYSTDEVQYFPASPDFVLTQEVQEHENDRLRRENSLKDTIGTATVP